MSVFYFTKKMDCTNPSDCFKSLWEKIIKLTPKAKLGVNMHVTLNHEKKTRNLEKNVYHEIWISYYQNSKFPNFVRDEEKILGKECKKFHIEESKFNPNDPKKENFTGKLPTLSQLKNM